MDQAPQAAHEPLPFRSPPVCVEVCAGAGGQSLGLERAGFGHAALVELDPDACATLRDNRPGWRVVEADVRTAGPALLREGVRAVELLAGGVPCPPFSLAGQQFGAADERDLFPAMLSLVEQLCPQAVMIENVKGLLQAKFQGYRARVTERLAALGYAAEWRLLRACDFGVPQLRPRAVLVALRPDAFDRFRWPEPDSAGRTASTVGEVLYESMAVAGWELAEDWAVRADQVAPTLCGGSRKHGGPDLGPSRARQAWARLGVNGSSLADKVPQPGDQLPVRLTVEQTALLQGFPPEWRFSGTKTARYRQVGNAFPPPVAEAVGRRIAAALAASSRGRPDLAADHYRVAAVSR
ncbi:DNA (cytosine-5-)-methyltransferase [Kitasatospora kazusensis]|uniref:DNA cytosine methyltransferase n=1 Tax=Kitasatospora kazusensis TaxID=407974 RepID=UPI0031D85A0E